MKRLLMLPWGLTVVGLVALWALAGDLRLWWGWRREDARAGRAAGAVLHPAVVRLPGPLGL